MAVIGCGPAGMSFMHANATRRRMMEQVGDSVGLQRLPASVTCYERSSGPGGVWKAERCHDEERSGGGAGGSAYTTATDTFDSAEEKKENDAEDVAVVDSLHKAATIDTVDTIDTAARQDVSGNMYEALWTNGAKERIEFCDYTYEDHFGKDTPLPTYMPRQPLLEYMVARVTRHNPTFFDDVRFETTVLNVTYDEDTAKFTVTARNNLTGEEDTAHDKCVWAAGDNGKPSFPRAMDELLHDDGFRGTTIHSSQVGAIDFETAVRDKNVLLVGDNFSSEDLALVAIKAGAAKVYIVSRSGKGS